MILTCQNCSTSFRLDESILKPSGSKVRCSRCKHIWRARPPADGGFGIDNQEAAEAKADSNTAAIAGFVAGAGVAARLAEDDQISDQTTEAEAAGTGTSSPPELKLGFDDLTTAENSDNDDNLVTDEINLDELDLLLEDEPLLPGSKPRDDFQTEELDLADLENILDDDTDASNSPPSDLPTLEADELNTIEEETDDSIMEDLDLDIDDLESLLSDDADLGDGRDSSDQKNTTTDTAEDEVKLALAPELEDLLEDDGHDLELDETEEISLSEVENATPDFSGAAASATSFEDDDIKLELAPGIEDLFDEVDDQDVSREETEDLDLSVLGEDSAELDEAAEEPETLELDLDAGTDAQPLAGEDQVEATSLETESQTPSDDDVEELALDDLESLLEDGAAEPIKLSPGEEQPELVLDMEGEAEDPADVDDLNLALDDLDLGAVEPSEQEMNDEADELDLDDFESLLDDAADTPPMADTASEVEGLELDLDLDLDGDTNDAEQDPDDATRELNLDDIEKILDVQETVPADSAIADEVEIEPQDHDLDSVDAASPEAVDADHLEEDETTEGSGALDLSDLEKMLDIEDTTDSPALSADEDDDDLDLDFDLQPTVDEEDELELEFDMLDDEGEEPSALFDTSESEDLSLDLEIGETPIPEKVDLEEDLEFEIMDGDASSESSQDAKENDADAASAVAPVAAAALGAAGSAASRDLTQELMDEMAAADTQTMDIPPAESKSEPIAEKKKSNRMLLLLFLLVLLGGGAYYLYTMMGSDGPQFKLSNLPQIPFISAWLGGNKTPEAVVPVETALKGSWVQNKTDGRLYIIQGRVKNEYSQPRSYIRVTGRIYADGRKFSKAAHAYCGNMPSREELENMPATELQKVLGNRSGANDANVMVAPGQEVPFTVVFAGLPDDVELQEYAVEISGSLPATKAKSQ
jgi:predicted Zn finger-like uncharacterized protein